jgi:peptidoglycan/LPS O-acetylase OafA/YrhL
MTRLAPAEYLASPGLWRFVAGTLATFKSSLPLPGVFGDNPLRFPMGTVWTLKYEVLCYVGVFVLGIAGLVRSRRLGLAVVVGLALALVLAEAGHPGPSKGVETALRLPLIFACGAAAYQWRDRLRLSGAAALVLLLASVALATTPAYKAMLFVATAYGALWLAFSPALARLGLEPGGDLSYGTYLYGWPLQQALHALFPALAPLALTMPSIALTLAVAAASWHFVEKPALNLKARALRGPSLKGPSLTPSKLSPPG